MTVNLSDLNDQQLSLIDPADRKELGAAARTKAEAQAKYCARLERHDHADFINECLRRRISYIHCDPVRRSRIQKGHPDFSLFKKPRKVLFVEFKVFPNKLSPEQEQKRRELEEAGWPYVVAYNLAEAIAALNTYLL